MKVKYIIPKDFMGARARKAEKLWEEVKERWPHLALFVEDTVNCKHTQGQMKGATMDREERNKVEGCPRDWRLDELLRCLDSGREFIIHPEDEWDRAVRECYRIARAWDELKEIANSKNWVKSGGGIEAINYENLVKLMARISNPSPKDPLEELEEWLGRTHTSECGRIHPADILAEIRRLRERGKK